MGEWYFDPWNLQYLIGGCAALSAGLYIVSESYKERLHQYFFLFGFSVALWGFFTFLQRSAPTPDLSMLFLRAGMFSLLLALHFLLMALILLRPKMREKKIVHLALAPALAAAFSVLLVMPLKVVHGSLGWTAYIPSGYITLISLTLITYTVATIIVGVMFIRKIYFFRSFQKKYRRILLASTAFVAGILVMPRVMRAYPDFTPFSGILAFVAFIVIAYAISRKNTTRWVVGEPKENPIPIEFVE